MKKCKKCKVGILVDSDGIKICYNCLNSPDSKSKKILSILQKNNAIKNYNKAVESEQIINTNYKYMRFRVFIIGD